MDISYLIQALQNKIIILSNAKAQAYSIGDLDGANTIDQELLSTQNTLAQLNLLTTINATAAAMNTTSTNVVASGIDATQNTSPSSSTVIVDGYDISTYATDPLYAEKLQEILNVMSIFGSPADVDAYIQNLVPGSPVTGAMVVGAATQYGVDIRLLTAILQLESQFGTQGTGSATFNPGNVGNTGTATQTYASWSDGVAAVAEWLSNHTVSNMVVAATQTSTSTDSTASSSTPNTTLDSPSSTPTVAPVLTTTTTTAVMPVTTTTTTSTFPLATSTIVDDSATSTSSSTIDTSASTTASSTSSSTDSVPMPVPVPPPIYTSTTISIPTSTSVFVPAPTSTDSIDINASSTTSTDDSATSTSQ